MYPLPLSSRQSGREMGANNQTVDIRGIDLEVFNHVVPERGRGGGGACKRLV